MYATTGYDKSLGNLLRVSLDSDNVFGDNSAATQLGTVSGNITSGYTVSLAVGVDTTTTLTVGQNSGDDPPPGSSGAPGSPPPGA